MLGNSFKPELSPLEIKNITAERKSLRLIAPAKCVLYHHVQVNTFHLIIQVIFGLLSISLFTAIAIYTIAYYQGDVEGFTAVDEATTFDKLSFLIVALIFLTKTRLLIKSEYFSKRTKLSLFCNGINLFMWVNFLLSLLYLVALISVLISFALVGDINAFELLTDNFKIGIAADVIDMFFNIFFIIFAWYSCRYFRSGVV
jgi:hypothetical protein